MFVPVLIEFIGWVCVLLGILPAGGGGVCGTARVGMYRSHGFG